MRFAAIAFISCLMAAAGLHAPAALAQRASDYDPAATGDLRPLPDVDAGRQDTRTTVDAPSGTVDSGDPAVFVGAVTISGLDIFAPQDFADIISERIGRSLSSAELASLATAIAARIRDGGYAFASAQVEPQRISNGILVVRVDEGRIDELRFDGPVPPSVRRALAPLLTGRPVRSDEVERRLMLTGDIDGVRIQSSRFVREGDHGVLLIQATQDRVAMRFALDNAGTKPIGPEQARVELDLNGVVASDDSLTMTYSTTPAEPRELQFGYVRYEKRLSAAGTELALMGSASVTHPGAYLAPLNIKNRSWFAAAGVLQPLLRRRKASFWLSGEFGLRNLTQWRSGRKVRDDQLTTARMTFYGYHDLAGGRFRMSATLSQGLGILGATSAGDPLASRWDADGTFTAVSLWSDWTTDLGGKFSLRLAAQGQIASQPLLVSEETSLGGTVFLRGYDWGERSGDEGAMGMAELRYLWNNPFGQVKRAQIYTFIDGGTVSNRADGFGGGALVSAGGGMRVDITQRLGASFEVAVPLSGRRYDTGDRTPKLNLALVRSF